MSFRKVTSIVHRADPACSGRHNEEFRPNQKPTIWTSRSKIVYQIMYVQSIDVFKVRLDKFWAQQEVMFDWTADLTGTGDRSEYTVESY